MPKVALTRVNLKGPAGSAPAADKRVKISRVDVHGPVDKRVVIPKVTLRAPPPSLHVRISQVHLVGPASPLRPVYYGTNNGWVAIDVYVPNGAVWKKVT